MDSAELELEEELSHLTFDQLARAEPHRARAAQAALAFYSTDGHLSINGAFRRVYGSNIPVMEEDRLRTATFMYAVEPAVIKSPFPLTLYRGVGRTEGQRIFEALERGEQGFEYTFPVSASYDERVAQRFSARFQTARGEREIRLTILVPEGTKIAFVELFSVYPGEAEILLLPRTRLIFDTVKEYPLLREIRIQAIAEQEVLPTPTTDVDEALIWHWQLCAGIDEEEEEEDEEHNELCEGFEIQEELCEESEGESL